MEDPKLNLPTRNLAKYIQDKGINITKLAKETGIAYWILYDSLLNSERKRELRFGEALSICAFLGVNPMDFAGTLKKEPSG